MAHLKQNFTRLILEQPLIGTPVLLHNIGSYPNVIDELFLV